MKGDKWWSDEGSDKDGRLYVMIELAEVNLRLPDTYLLESKYL
jgi:hypothetical protein